MEFFDKEKNSKTLTVWLRANRNMPDKYKQDFLV